MPTYRHKFFSEMSLSSNPAWKNEFKIESTEIIDGEEFVLLSQTDRADRDGLMFSRPVFDAHFEPTPAG